MALSGWIIASMQTTAYDIHDVATIKTVAPSARVFSRLPEYTRIPTAGGRCPITGLSRSSVLKLIYATAENGHKPPVHSFALKKKGGFRGARLISVASLIDYIESHGAEGSKGGSS